MKDDGVIHVFEAVITGILVLTAVLFLTGLSAPSASQGGTAIDLARLAGDSLSILEARPPDDPDVGLYDHRLEQVVDYVMTGRAADADAWLREVLPTGTRYLLRIDNGVEPLSLLPQGGGPAASPRGAQAAETFLLPNWTANVDPVAPAPAEFRHHEQLPFDVGSCALVAPTGVMAGPTGTWNAMWAVGDTTVVPAWLPYGWWTCGGNDFRIVPPDGTSTDYALYAIQLVVWPGA